MPTVAEYRRAAQEFRRHSAEFADDARNGRPTQSDTFVGPVADTHADALAAIAADRGRAAEALQLLAVACDRRAEVYERYARDLARWHARPADRRRPDPPEPWVAP